MKFEIMRTLVNAQALTATQSNLAKPVFDALRELMTPPETPKRPIGFDAPQDKEK